MEEAVFLFDKSKELIEIVSPEDISDNEQTGVLNGLITHYATGKHSKKVDEAHFFGMHDVDDDSIFLMYKIDKRNTENKRFELEGTHILFDDLKGRGGVMKDRRPTNEPVQRILPDILAGTGWTLGNVYTSNTGTSNYYYVSKLQAFWDFLEKWRVEFVPRIVYSKGKIVRKEIDIYNQLSGDHGKWYEKGDKLLTVLKEEDASGVYTAFIGRGKGEEVGDGFGRRIGFEEVEWSTANGDPVNKPLGQDYVEIPWATAEYGYEDGTPRYAIVEFEEIDDNTQLLEATYTYAVEESRPKAHFRSNVIESGLAELGEIVTIISDDENIRYKTRIFKLKRDFKRKKVKTIEFGDKLVRTRAERVAAVDKTIRQKELQNLEWLDQIREEIVDSYFNNDGYNYELQAGNEYDLPGGYYSFDRPIDQSPTKVIYMGAGQLLIANSKRPNGEWDWRTAATGDGFVADAINTGTLRAEVIKNSGIATFGDVDDATGDAVDGIKDDLATEGRTIIHGGNITTGTIRSEIIENSGIATFGTVDNAFDSANKYTDEETEKAITEAKNYTDGKDKSVRETIDLTRQQIENDFDDTLGEYAQIEDTRDVNSPPSWYYENYPKRNVREFKRTTVMGVGSNLETYGTLLTEVPWSDTSGGRIKQSFYVHDKIFTRSGTSSWTSWKETPNADELATAGQTVINGENITTGKIKDRNGNTIFDLNNGDLRFNHADGSYTRAGRSGFERFTSSDRRNYHYLASLHTFTFGESSNNARWVQLPDDFKGKNFGVYLAIADSMQITNYNYAIQRFVCTRHPNHGIDYARARVPVIAYKSETLSNGVAPRITNVQGLLIAIY